MARVFSWIIEAEGKTAYTYITNAEGNRPLITDYRIPEEDTDFKAIYYNANKLSENEYKELFAEMQQMANEEFGYKDGENIIEGDYTDYFGENENYILLSGVDGKDAEKPKDAVTIAYRYKRYADAEKFADDFQLGLTEEQVDNKITSDEGWADSPNGISSEYTVEAVAEKKSDAEHWNRPVIWSKWGVDGRDGEKGKDGTDGKDGRNGNSIEYVFCNTVDDSHRPEGFYVDAECSSSDISDSKYQEDEFLPYSKLNGTIIQWLDNPKSPDAENRTVWCAIRKKSADENSTWGEFSEPVIWSRYAVDGKDGANGINGKDGSGINVYLTNQSCDVFPNEDGSLNYEKATSDIVVMNGTEELLNNDFILTFDGFTSHDNEITYSNADGSIEFTIGESTVKAGRKNIKITKVSDKGHSYISITANYQSLVDATTMDVELDYNGRVEISFNTNSYRYADNSKDAPINKEETIILTAAYYNGFTVNNTRWEIIDGNGAWAFISSGETSLAVPYDSELWNNRNEIFIRCYGEIKNDNGDIQETDYDIVSLFKFYDGKNGKDGENGKDGVNADGLTVVLDNPVAEVYPVAGIDGNDHIEYENAKTGVKLFIGSNIISEDKPYTISLLNNTGWISDGEGKYSNDFAKVEIDNNIHEVKLIEVIKPWNNLLTVPIVAEYNGIKAVFAWLVEYDTDGNRIEISADANTFLEKDGKYDRDEIKFESKFVGGFTASNTKWQIGNNGQWIDIEAARVSSTADGLGTTFTLSRETDMKDVFSLRVRCFGQLITDTAVTDYDELSVFKLREGANGKNGADGLFIEYIYKRANVSQLPDESQWPDKWETSQEDGYLGPVEYGWTNNPVGIESSNKYEFVSKREKKNGQWSAFSIPALWAAWGEKGSDGVSTEYIFFLTATADAPTIDAYDINSDEYQEYKYLPSTNSEKWSDNPQDLTNEKGFQWVSVRTYNGKKWEAFSTPSLWNRMARDGAKGETGAIYRYKGEWNSGNTYVSNTQFIDYVSYGTGGTVTGPLLQYWSLKEGLEGDGLKLGIPSENSGNNWTKFFVAESIATNFLLSDQVKTNILEATKGTFEEVSANTLDAAYAEIGRISAETLDAAYAQIGTVSANTLSAAKAEIEKLSANTVNANTILAQNIETNKASIDELKARSIVANEIHAVKADETEGVRQGADIDATQFLLFYSSSTVDSRVYLQIMPEYTIPAEADGTGDYFTEGRVLKNVPVLVMEYATKHGQIKRFLDPFISWKPYEKVATESWTWYKINAYETRNGLSFTKKIDDIYLVKSSHGKYVTNSNGDVVFFKSMGRTESTDRPSVVITGKTFYISYGINDDNSKNMTLYNAWSSLFGYAHNVYAYKNLATESWAVSDDSRYIKVGVTNSGEFDDHESIGKLFDSTCKFAAQKLNFKKYSTSTAGKVTISTDASEYYFTQEGYPRNSSTPETYAIKTNLTGETLTKGSDSIDLLQVWSRLGRDALNLETDSSTLLSYGNDSSTAITANFIYQVDINYTKNTIYPYRGSYWDLNANNPMGTFVFDNNG